MSLKALGKALDGGLKTAKQKHATKLPSAKRFMPLDHIKDRPHGNARPLNKAHIEELAESIAIIGLIQPIAVDQAGYLLAGGHRRAALHSLREQHPQIFESQLPGGQVPVRVFEFEAKTEAEQAIAIEAAENEKRRDYTPSEVRDLAERLVAAGYKDTPGRPKKGQKALVPALMTIVGKSKRTVKSYLASETEQTRQEKVQACTIMKRTIKALTQLESLPKEELNNPKVQAQTATLRKLLEEELLQMND